MNFFEREELDQRHDRLMEVYDDFIRNRIPESYAYPIRMRDWELARMMDALEGMALCDRILDTGSVNTFFGLWLAKFAKEVVVSDLLFERIYKNVLRRLGILPRKKSEARIESWFKAIKSDPTVKVRNVDLTRMDYPDDSFDLVASVSVIEHIPDVEKAIAEMHRCLKRGGKLLITTDCSPEGAPYSKGVRYFSPQELTELFASYQVTSMKREPNFKRNNWCYKGDKPVLTAFIEVTK